MRQINQTSLGNQVAKKISAWILVLVVAIISAIFAVSFFLSRQMFNNQVNSWITIAPQYALTNLIDSDDFSIKREVNFLKSTGLFSSFVITNNQKRIISMFGSGYTVGSDLIPIKDEANIVWGYYSYKTDFYSFFKYFFIAGAIIFILVLIFYYITRLRIRSSLEIEFLRFNNFLSEIQQVTERIHEIYDDDQFNLDLSSTYSAEQIIINRAISKLLGEIQKANRSLRDAISAAEKQKFQEELTRTAVEVTHDIGSPLAVIEAIVQSAYSIPESSRVALRNAADRLRDISQSLMIKTKQNFASQLNAPLTQHMLSILINQVVSEKRLQYKQGICIEFQAEANGYGIFSIVKAPDFCRAISNLINNSIEACNEGGSVLITLASSPNTVVICIKDNGKGVPENILKILGKLGGTHGKPNGIGIGLHYAIDKIEGWGGKLQIESRLNQGTVVTIILPRAKPPLWFAPMIKLTDGQTIVVIDDDESIHEVWKKKLNSDDGKVKNFIHLYSPEETIEWDKKKSIDGDILYLCDYEFIGSKINGIELIKKLKIAYISMLVTSRANSDEIITECELSNVKLLAKEMANFIPII